MSVFTNIIPQAVMRLFSKLKLFWGCGVAKDVVMLKSITKSLPLSSLSPRKNVKNDTKTRIPTKHEQPHHLSITASQRPRIMDDSP